jgi:phage shock protein B
MPASDALPQLFILFFCLMALLIPFVIVAMVIKGSGRSRREMPPEDIGTVQEMHGDLERMEKRIEALETILLERTKER